MEFVIYNSVEDTNHIREMISNKFLSINLCCYQIIFYTFSHFKCRIKKRFPSFLFFLLYFLIYRKTLYLI